MWIPGSSTVSSPIQKSRENKVGKNMWMFCETQEKKWTKKNCETDGGEILLVNLKWTNFGDYVHQGW